MPNRRQAVNGLPDRAWNLLRHGDSENRYDGDGSRLVGAVVLLAVNSGANRDWTRSLLADPQHPGGFAALRRRRDVDRWFDQGVVPGRGHGPVIAAGHRPPRRHASGH
jgi:hypothetical protein